ncbi:hypothetical protein HDU84_008961 [Entophlyctis sp. JEL0112]|nr:hypothetical protein HDU84_008961 [Entophlyctis sp. JEL0112]
MDARPRPRRLPALLMAAVGCCAMLATIYLHVPASPAPAVVVRRRLAFPFRLRSPPLPASANPDDYNSDVAVLLVRPSPPHSLHVVCVTQRPPSLRSGSNSPASEPPYPIAQFYDLDSLNLLSTSTNISDAVALRYRGAERIPGELQVTAISKFARPDPSVAFLYYLTKDEGYSFHVKVVEIAESSNSTYSPIYETVGAYGQADSPANGKCLSSESKCSDGGGFYGGCINFVTSNDNGCIHEGPPVNVLQYSLPGNMWINRFIYTFNKRLLYARQLETSSFRLISTDDESSMTEHKINAETGVVFKSLQSNGGPIVDKSILGKSLMLVELHAEGEGQAVLDIRYKATKNDDAFWFYVFLNHRPSPSSPWTQTRLIRSLESLRQFDEISFRSEDFYFVTNPVVAVSQTGKCAVFMYKGVLHVLDFVGSPNLLDEAPHGFTLMKSRLINTLQSDIRMRGAVIHDDGLFMAMVTDADNIITLRREYLFREKVASSGLSDLSASNVFLVPYEVNFVFDALLQQQQPANQNLPKSPATMKENIERYGWSVEKIWSPEIFNDPTILDTSIVSVAFIPPANTEHSGGGSSASVSPQLAILWKNDLLLILDLDSDQTSSFVATFLIRKWPMFAAMTVVVAFFVINEMRFWARDAVLRQTLLNPRPWTPVAANFAHAPQSATARSTTETVTTETNVSQSSDVSQATTTQTTSTTTVRTTVTVIESADSI